MGLYLLSPNILFSQHPARVLLASALVCDTPHEGGVARYPASGSEKGVLWKRGLVRKVHVLEILENLEILEILENPQTVENKAESDHVLEVLENLELFREILFRWVTLLVGIEMSFFRYRDFSVFFSVSRSSLTSTLQDVEAKKAQTG